jgi:hypothetical protein
MVEVQSLWVGNKLGDLEINCIKSHLRVGHIFILYVYEPISNLPDGIEVRDAREILNERYLGLNNNFGFYPLSDIFRFNLLYKKGGIWVDMDMYANRGWECLEDKEYIFASERTIQKGAYRNRTKDKVATISMLKAPKKSGFYYELCLRVCSDKFKVTRRDICMVELRKMLEKFDMDKYIVDFYLFCPVDWWNAKEMFLDGEFKEKYGVLPMEKKDVLEKSYGIHFWRHIVMNKYAKLCLTKHFGKKSIYKTFT